MSSYDTLGWHELRKMCDRYGLDVVWDVRSSGYRIFVWAWNWPEVGPQTLGRLSMDDLNHWSADHLEEFVVSCTLKAIWNERI
jgi:hypothetical protein